MNLIGRVDLTTMINSYNSFNISIKPSMERNHCEFVTNERINDVVANIFKAYDTQQRSHIDFIHFRKMIDDLDL